MLYRRLTLHKMGYNTYLLCSKPTNNVQMDNLDPVTRAPHKNSTAQLSARTVPILPEGSP